MPGAGGGKQGEPLAPEQRHQDGPHTGEIIFSAIVHEGQRFAVLHTAQALGRKVLLDRLMYGIYRIALPFHLGPVKGEINFHPFSLPFMCFSSLYRLMVALSRKIGRHLLPGLPQQILLAVLILPDEGGRAVQEPPAAQQGEDDLPHTGEVIPVALVREHQHIPLRDAGKVVGGKQVLHRLPHLFRCAAFPLRGGAVKGKFYVHVAPPCFLVAHIIPYRPGNIQINRQTVQFHAACASSCSIRSLARRAYSSVTSMPVAV